MTTFTSDLNTAKTATNGLAIGGAIGTTNADYRFYDHWQYPTYIYPSTITVTGQPRPDADSVKLAASVIKRLLTKEMLEQFNGRERDELKLALAVLSKE